MNKKHINLPLLISIALMAGGCANSDNLVEKEALLNEKEAQLKEKEDALALRENALQSQDSIEAKMDNQLLPSFAKPGECYARVWNDAKFIVEEEKVLVQPEKEELITKDAIYKTVTEEVLVAEASSKVVAVPAVYKTEKEQVLISKGERTWRTMPSAAAPLVPEDILTRARNNGVDFDSATPNMCFHEHLLGAKLEKVKEQVLVKEASESVSSVPANYRTVEKRVLVKEASTQLITVPAVYETVTEQVIDKPAHQVWKKGTGAIQKIDASTGEIMCLVDVPATYTTVTKKVLKTPATTKEVEIPAEYKMVSVQEVVSAASEERTPVPAQYTYVEKMERVGEDKYVWHEIHDNSLTKDTRTGNQICLVETKDQYKTVEKTVEVTPATFNTIEVPAKYQTVSVQKIDQPASVERKITPAQYETIKRDKLIEQGRMEWRSILCETNMTTSRISDIQTALVAKGYNPGAIDGVIGSETMAAVNAFQRDNDLPVDEYLNILTLEALGVTTK